MVTVGMVVINGVSFMLDEAAFSDIVLQVANHLNQEKREQISYQIPFHTEWSVETDVAASRLYLCIPIIDIHNQMAMGEAVVCVDFSGPGPAEVASVTLIDLT